MPARGAPEIAEEKHRQKISRFNADLAATVIAMWNKIKDLASLLRPRR
jgi:hypothetical protein